MKPRMVVLTSAAALLLGAGLILAGTGYLLIDEVNNYRYTKHFLDSTSDIFSSSFRLASRFSE